MTGFLGGFFDSVSPAFSAMFKQDSKSLICFLKGLEGKRPPAWSQMIGELRLEWCNKSNSTLTRRLLTGAKCKSVEIPDIVDFTRQRLGFDPNPLHELALRAGGGTS